ncbi:AmiS/UreI family transporter [Mycolicibacterium bacteremicum]|uniref:Transporter n=1 Tax=Mycolicibacterium bacteremicum TaxID=564198 RepID=A0A1W9YRD8_MYCBA|nr:AmiS/UreI family transporter [Mycolicibacterium bacteremicum]MCV7433536.1 transporter [Mycolicibacterium bacteremicum]ORA02604.1 transporter [Mycolicibacterium bacteremicum]
MNNVGLLYVGAVLFVNGLMLLGRIPARSAAVLNLFVGALQCIVPTVMLIQGGGDTATTLAASGLYLFGFTYLYVGIVNLAGLEPEGLGWFSLFVAMAAVVYSVLSFTVSADPVFGVIWLSWAVLWLLFFLVLGLGRQELTAFTGWAVTLLSLPTCAVPAFLAMTGNHRTSAAIAVAWAVGLSLLLVVAKLMSATPRRSRAQVPTRPIYS